jgi:hypothetical protein
MSGDRPLTFDVYASPDDRHASLPAVILATGYSDVGAQRMLGCRFKEMGAFVTWARLLAQSGVAAITYENDGPNDLDKLVTFVRDESTPLRLDRERLGMWACSGHGPNALAALRRCPEAFRAVALLYAYTLDRPGRSEVADAATQFRFSPAPGVSARDLPPTCSLFVGRAGRDEMPGLNVALDAFVVDALTANLPMTLVNHATAAHAFDLFDNSRATHDVIRAVLRFLSFHLVTEP